MEFRSRVAPSTVILCLAAVLSLLAPWARAAAQSGNSASYVEVVRRAVANEVASQNQGGFFMWMDRVQKPKGSETKLIVQTSEGAIGRTVAMNDKPLTPEQRKKDDERIQRWLDPSKMREKAKQQKEDDEHTLNLLRALPDAFLYENAGTGTAPHGDHILKLNFKPNPNFNPPNRETQVFEGMTGQLWIDTTANRIAKIDGTLFKDVTFGWGVLGRLYKGGRFVVEQAEMVNGHWDTAHERLDFTGKILIVKSLRIDEDEREWDFHPVPKMDVRQALDMLQKSGDQYAQAAPRISAAR